MKLLNKMCCIGYPIFFSKWIFYKSIVYFMINSLELHVKLNF
jgi:hypothetical protein